MSEMRPAEWLLLIVMAALAFILAGAEMAAMLLGSHRWLPEAGGALEAALRLPAHLADPRQAWPSRDTAALPGPVGYWAVQCTLFAAVLGVNVLARGRWPGGGSSVPGSRRARRLGADPRARLAVRADVLALVVPHPTPGRLTLGKLDSRHGPLLATEDEHPAGSRGKRRRSSGRASVVVIGPTRSGKTAGFAVPSLLEWHGPAIALSVKDDLYQATKLAREATGEIKVFDPRRSLRAVSGARWSPVTRASTLAGAMRAARGLAAASPSDDASDGRFWAATAEDLLGPLLYAANLARRDMSAVVKWVVTQDGVGGETAPHEVEIILARHQRDGNEDATQALRQARSTWRLSDRTRDSVFLMARGAVRPWSDPEVADSSIRPDITVDWLLGGNNTLYVCAPAHMQTELLPVFVGIASEVIDGAYEAAQAAGGVLGRRLLVVIDEAANIAPLPDMPRYAATAAGHGIQLVSVWQDLAQIRTRYGAAASTVINNHLAKVVLAGISDPDTLELVSRLLGEEEYAQVSRSAQLDELRHSISETVGTRRLAPMDLIRRITPGEGCLIYGTLQPAHLVLRPYYEERALRDLSAGHRNVFTASGRLPSGPDWVRPDH